MLHHRCFSICFKIFHQEGLELNGTHQLPVYVDDVTILSEDVTAVNRVGICGLDASGSGWGPVAGSFEHGKAPSVSIKAGKFLDYFSDY
jgi:hypothetical protein